MSTLALGGPSVAALDQDPSNRGLFTVGDPTQLNPQGPDVGKLPPSDLLRER